MTRCSCSIWLLSAHGLDAIAIALSCWPGPGLLKHTNDVLMPFPWHFLPQALNMYKELLAMPDPDPLYYTYAAACEYYMGMYKEAEATALKVRHDKL